MARACTDCGVVDVFDRARCPRCRSEDVHAVELPSIGTIESWTLLVPRSGVSLVILLVRFPAGWQVMGNYLGPESDLRVGASVEYLGSLAAATGRRHVFAPPG